MCPVRSPLRARRQHGMSLLGLLLVGIVVGFGLLIVLKVFPTVSEYYAIKKAVQRAIGESSDVAGIQSSFDKSSQIDDFTALTGKDLVISKNGDKVTVSFSYEKRIPLFGPASLLLDYQGSESR